ncbi:MAG: hypothetical protein OEZ34_09135 [Spirochaetia bacterium]|nr:hypothetical protein [Spirochaetia bacterium]
MPYSLNDRIHINKNQANQKNTYHAEIKKIEIRSLQAKKAKEKYKYIFEKAAALSIFNSGKFKSVCWQSSRDKRTGIDCRKKNDQYNFEIVFYEFIEVNYGYFKDRNLWILTWPVLYPLPLIYPFQPVRRDFRTELIIKIKNETLENPILISLVKRREYSILLYGFFRKRKAELILREMLEKSLFEFTEILKEKEVL